MSLTIEPMFDGTICPFHFNGVLIKESHAAPIQLEAQMRSIK
jgi:hypothetical protein